MLAISPNFIKYAELVFSRIKIFTFLYLATVFARMFISGSAEDHPYMAMWGNILFETAIIIVFSLLYGTDSNGRDINTINLYGICFHLIYVLCYFYGYRVGVYHNNAVACLNGLIVLRLFYFGNREFFSRISIIGYSKDWLLDSRWFFNAYVNGLTIVLFILCAIPLFTLIYIINTDQMRVIGIATVLYAFFVAIDYSNKNREARATSETVPIKVIRAEAATQDIAEQLKDAQFVIRRLKETCKALGTIVIGLVIFGLIITEAKNEEKFHLGYYFGYEDALHKVAPKVKADWKTIKKCYLESSYRSGSINECIRFEQAMESK